MKKKLPEQEVKELCWDIIRERNQWKHINDKGCNDPFWPDGCNMNLTRQHIISDRIRIKEICEENNMILPDEYYLPIPPKVNHKYMANMDQEERVKRLIQTEGKLSCKKTVFEDQQLSFT